MSKRRTISRLKRCQTIGVAVQILTDLDTEFSLQCAEDLKNGNHALYLDRKPPLGGDCWRDFFRNYQATELMSKYDGLNLDINRGVVALQGFMESEEHCRAMNTRFWRIMRNGVTTPPLVMQALELARRKLDRILGVFSWDEAVPLMDFGPGASIGLRRVHRHSYFKFGLERPTVTGECAIAADILVRMSPQWSSTVSKLPGGTGHDFSVVVGSRVTTVPKNAKTDRVICIEPVMNMYVQKGIGGMLRRCLRSLGVNLDSQERNQQLAREGSLTGRLATLDLRRASDTISLGLVEYLLPECWVTAMKICRSKHCVLPDGGIHFLQKFSSMGNGFTFELESLIFWAFCSSVAELVGESSRDISIYGDDLIVPRKCVELLIEVLAFAGFETNTAKSFSDGPFRESCGKHYYLGHDVTPLYIRKDVGVDQERLLWLANGIKRLAHRMVGYGYGCDGRLKSSYDDTCQKINRRYRELSIPEGLGDGGLVRDFDEARPMRHKSGNRKKPSGYDAWIVRHLQRRYTASSPGGQPTLTLSLHGLEKASERRRVNRAWLLCRDTPMSNWGTHLAKCEGVKPVEIDSERFSHRIVTSVTPRWEGLGPWVPGF